MVPAQRRPWSLLWLLPPQSPLGAAQRAETKGASQNVQRQGILEKSWSQAMKDSKDQNLFLKLGPEMNQQQVQLLEQGLNRIKELSSIHSKSYVRRPLQQACGDNATSRCSCDDLL